MNMKIFTPFGLRHEIAKRWTLWDWYKSLAVAKKINPAIADRVISDLIMRGQPALVGRLGGTESRFLGEYLKVTKFKHLSKIQFRIKHNWIKRSREINTNAGFYFEDVSQVEDFYKLYDAALLNTDVLGAWGTAFAWIESCYSDKINSLVPVPMTAPWVDAYKPAFENIPWSNSLHSKRVLVISPFAESIEKQHKIIEKVFPNVDYPEFVLSTIKAPQTIGFDSNSKPDWFENLNNMKKLMSGENFDVALVAAGAYSYPLAHHAKQLGRIGIHAGGGLQLFFGILGKRWETNWGKGNYLENYHNDYWTRPSKTETPTNYIGVEDGCYW
jgi:hypothetical protein